MRTFHHVPAGQARLQLAIGAATVTVHAENRDDVTVTLTPADSADTVAADLIERATSTVSDDELRVNVPRAEASGRGQTTIVRSGGHVRMTSHSVGPGSVVIGSINGVTVVNGQVITGFGTTIIGGGGGLLRADVRMPHDSNLTVDTDSADVTTAGPLDQVGYRAISGSLDLDVAETVTAQTVSGGIDANTVITSLDARTTSGDIRVGMVDQATLYTISGDVRIRDANGTVRASTTSGDITVHVVHHARVTAGSVSGDVRVTHEPGAQVDARLDSVSGRVRGPKAVR
jgi:hypothetical protein